MKTFIKLLLLAAVALPSWSAATAQTDAGSVQHRLEIESKNSIHRFSVNPKTLMATDDNKTIQQKENVVQAEQKVQDSYVSGNVEFIVKDVPQQVNVNTIVAPQKTSPRHAPRKKEGGNQSYIIVQTDYSADICDGTATSNYEPLWVPAMTATNTANQFIYPASELGIPTDSYINAISFYATSNLPTTLATATVQVRVGLTDATTITSVQNMIDNRGTMTVVYSGSLKYSGNIMTVTFNESFAYNEEKNLIVDFLVTGAGSMSTNTNYGWNGQSATSGSSYATYNGSTSGNSQGALSFLPKMTVSYFTWESPEAIDFGAVMIGSESPATKNAKINSDESVTVNLSTDTPFGVSPATLNPGQKAFTLTFTPTQSINYTGTLNLDINGQTASVPMKGVGFKAGEKAMRDSKFFEGITYTWKEWQADGNGKEHTNNLNEIATNPDQIIAMLKKIYMDPSIPGNLKRGFSSTGADEAGNLVNYPGVGAISHTGTSYSSGYSYEDEYGWDIKGDLETPVTNKSFYFYQQGSYYSGYADYCYMDSMQYKPDYDGLTLVLIETLDDFKYANVTAAVNGLPTGSSSYLKLRTQIANTVKSARVISEAVRTGTGLNAGTLFKLDVDKLNKFFLLAKGQLRRIMNSYVLSNSPSTYHPSFLANPAYIRARISSGMSTQQLASEFFDGDTGDPFYHMFEQFAPVAVNASAGKDDLYQALAKDMQSFGVKHDCAGIPMMSHHFMMYGDDSWPDDCADVRDMMFFVPDYRMMKFADTSVDSEVYDEYNRDRSDVLRYLNYHREHMPTLGLFVIKQDPIPEGEEKSRNTTSDNKEEWTGIYRHQLQWKSNLDEFLSSDEQYYELWEVVYDDFGVKSYQPVYYRNEYGQYTAGPEENAQVVTTPVRITLDRAQSVVTDENDPDKGKLRYVNVYVDMKAGSQIKTYVIQGRDKGVDGKPFLTLQMSNEESIVIPPLDPNEKTRLLGATYYSRFNPENVKNCYSVKLQMENNAAGLSADDVNGKKINFYRISRPAKVDAAGNAVIEIVNDNDMIQYEDNDQRVLFAQGTLNNGNLSIQLFGQDDKTLFPVGKSDEEAGEVEYYAGYHTNENLTFPYTTKPNGMLDFGNLYFWDNFTVDVSKNAHPLQYLYKMEVADADGNNVSAYSNNVRVPIYKTASRLVNLTLEQVVNDTDMSDDYTPGNVNFEEKFQYSSRTELLRYDAYRWVEGEKRYIVDEIGVDETNEEDPVNVLESDIAPTGIAINQGESYTLSMNKVQEPMYYYDCPDDKLPQVSASDPYTWATFVDYYPKQQGASGYVYAPVVELFTKGYREELVNNKRIERNDYNTYGGPLQSTAVGKLKLEIDPALGQDSNHAFMSTYYWENVVNETTTEWCAYYDIPIKFTALDLPEGYQIYKVRAWREVDPLVLREEYASRAGRKVAKYLYEEINYGDDLGLGNGTTMTDAELFRKPTGAGSEPYSYVLGSRNPQVDGWFTTSEATLDTEHETHATFGALRINTKDGKPYSMENLEATLKVRAYFVKTSDTDGHRNPLVTIPNRDEVVANPADFDYYVAEGEVKFKSSGYEQIITGISAVKMDVNREVVGVTYVNALGMMSSTPWQGINIVVTRYSDGSTTTKKVIR